MYIKMTCNPVTPVKDRYRKKNQRQGLMSARETTILLVEDETIISFDICESIRKLGLGRCVAATSAEAAIQIASASMPDIVLMDINLKGEIDGIEAARTIRKKADIPIIYITANADTMTVSRARDTMPFGYINKPINPRDLFTSIDSALVKSRMDRRLRESEVKYRRLVEEINDALYSLDENGIITFISPVIEQIAGFSPENVVGRHFADFIHHDDLVLARMIFNDPNYSSSNYPRIRISTNSGEYKYVKISSRSIHEDGIFRGSRGILTDMNDIKRSEEALRDSEAKFRTFVEAAPVAIMIYQGECWIYANPRSEDLTGYTHDVLCSMKFWEFVHPDYRETVKERGLARLRGEKQPSAYEFAIITADGRKKWIDFKVELITLQGKSAGMAFGIDVTARKKAEEDVLSSLREKEILLKEVHHRVANNFQIITSLMNLQAGKIGDRRLRQLFNDSRNRIRSIAAVHEKIYVENDLSRVDMSQYVNNLVMDLRHMHMETSRNARIALRIGKIEMVPETAIPCGLIINELVSNSLKHAFSPDFKGNPEIKISITTMHENTVELEVSDNGVGLPENINIISPDSLGFSLLRHLAEQLKATAVLSRQGGTTCTITFMVDPH